MRMHHPLVALILLAALVGAADVAQASDLYVVVDGTTTVGQPTTLTIRAAQAGPVLVRAWRIQKPLALLGEGLALDRGETLRFLDPRYPRRSAKQNALFQAAGLRPALVGTPFPVPAKTPTEMELRLAQPGIYLIAVTQGRRSAIVTALVSDLGLLVKRDAKSTSIWAVHRTTGRPWPGAAVTGFGRGAPFSATTDANGRVWFGAGIPPTVTLCASSGEHLAVGRSQAWPAPDMGRKVYLHTHQPAYRPGERVEIRGIVRTVGESGPTLDPTVREATVRLLAPGDKAHGEAVAPVSVGMGTFATGFDLPKDAPTGDWAIVASVAGQEFEAPLVVAAYRKPSFEVQVRGAAPRLLVGQPTHFDVEAAFYDGGRLAGAKVTWQLLHQRIDRELFPEDELVKLFFGTEREAYRPQPLATGEGVLDGEGRLRVDVEGKAGLASGALSLQATVRGPDRTAVVGSGRVALSAEPLVLDLRSDRHVYGPEDVARVTVRVERWDGAPATAVGTLTVGLAPEDGGEETWLHHLPIVAKNGKAVLDAPLAGAGRYLLRAVLQPEGAPTSAPPITAQLHVWAAGERATPGPVGSTLEVIADRDHYAVGDTARLLVLPAGGARPVLVTVERDLLLEARWLVPGEMPPVFTLDVEEAHVPNVFVTFTSVDQGRVFSTTRIVRIPPRSRLLTTQVQPDAAAVAPGAQSGLTIRVTDSADAPVGGAEVDVAVVDEALFALHSQPTAPLEAFFHPPHRNAVSTEALLVWQSVGWSPADPAEDKSMPGSARPNASPSAPTESGPPVADAAPGMRGPAGSADDAQPPPEPSPEMVEEEEALLEDAEEGHGGLGGRGRSARVALKKGKARRQAERVREDFRSAVFWAPALRTQADGTVRLDAVPYGDSLTRWRITAHALDASTRVGTGTGAVRTKLDVAATLTLPRFLRAGDRATLPLVLRNLTNEKADAEWTLTAGETPLRNGTLDLAAHAVETVETEFTARSADTITFSASVATTAGGDAEKRELSVLPCGIHKVVGRTLFARAGESTLELTVPTNAEPGSTTCRVSLEPGYVQAMAGALPYLLDYPYGCTEQTLSRFVPLVAAQEALSALGRPNARHAAELDKMIDAGVKRLAVLRHPDGGFGWWEHDATDPGMTALVVRGLSRLLAARPDNAAAKTLRNGAAETLEKLAGTETDAATRASMLLALVASGRWTDVSPPATSNTPWRDLPAVGQALLLRAAVATKQTEVVTALGGTLDDRAHRKDGRMWWSATGDADPTRWQDDAITTTAEVLHALLEAGVRPEVLDAGAQWLLEARVGGDRWRSTRDTAAAVEFLAAYVRATGDLGAGREVALALDGDTLWHGRVTPETAPEGVVYVTIPESALTPGETIRLTLVCPEGSASAGVALRLFETGPAIAASEAGFRVTRRFFRLERDGSAVNRSPVTETLPSGTLVECELVVETDRPREYVMVTSPHAGGFEPMRAVGLDVPGRKTATEAREDARDDRTVFFVARLAAGSYVFRHTMRATHAGAFTALPATAELMYFPDVRGSSNGEQWQVTPAGPVGEGR